MAEDLIVQMDLVVPAHELEITASRSGGAGGQHVNKTSSRITVRWNIKQSSVLSDEQKILLQQKLSSRLTEEGDLIIHNGESRSQQHNKKRALATLAALVRQALYIPKKRVPTKIAKSVKESRLRSKSRRSTIKKLRNKKMDYE